MGEPPPTATRLGSGHPRAADVPFHQAPKRSNRPACHRQGVHATSIVFPVNELLEWPATGWIGRSLEVLGRVANRNRLAEDKPLGYPEQALGFGGGGPRVAGAGEVADGRTETLGPGSEEDPLGESTLVIRVQIRNFWMHDDGNTGPRGGEMTGVRAFDRRQ